MSKKCSTINITDEAQAAVMGLLQDGSKKSSARKLVSTAESAAGPNASARKNLNVTHRQIINSCMRHYAHVLEK